VRGVFFPCVYARAARSFFSSCVVERCSLAAHQPLLWLGCASCFSASSRDAGAWHVQQLARVLRQSAALQRLRQPAAPPSIFFSRECIVARTRAAAVRTAAWRRFLSLLLMCVCAQQPGGASAWLSSRLRALFLLLLQLVGGIGLFI
jgi:hypothetical protein